MLEQLIPPAALAVPPETLAEHLHLNIAAPELDQTDTLTRFIGAATATIERQLQSGLIVQTWRWSTDSWCATLPLTPVAAVEKVEIVTGSGEVTPWDGWFLITTGTPRIGTRKGQVRPSIPPDGYALITFTTGYGTGWTDIPHDLRQAVILLAAHYFEHREAAADPLAALPFGVASLLAPYRPIRL